MLSAKNDQTGDATDWWFMYKLPKDSGPTGKKTKGNEYLYYDGDKQRTLALSSNTLGTAAKGALYHTMVQLLTDNSESIGWIHYNDEYPYSLQREDWPPNRPPKYYSENAREKDRGHPIDNSHNGHCKGTLAFDLATDTAFWLSHSTPRIPGLHLENDEDYFYPEYAYTYAQTFICISLKDVATANRIAEVLSTQHEPQVFGCRLPSTVTQNSKWPDLWRLAQGIEPPSYSSSYIAKHGKRDPADIEFSSQAGKSFRLIAKSGAWHDDFWINLVGPKLDTDLRVETWRRLTASATLPENVDSSGNAEYGQDDSVNKHKDTLYHHEFVEGDGQHDEDEITNLDLAMLNDSQGQSLQGYTWAYTHDHSKWALSEKPEERGVREVDTESGTDAAWVCVADLNRMTSQEKRGGGAICFHEPTLWQDLNEIERIGGDIT